MCTTYTTHSLNRLFGSDSRNRIPAGCQGGDSVYHHPGTEDGGEQQPRGQVAEEGKVEPDLDPKIPPDVMDGLGLVPRLPVGPLPVEKLSLTVDNPIRFGLVGALQGGGHLLEHWPGGGQYHTSDHGGSTHIVERVSSIEQTKSKSPFKSC